MIERDGAAGMPDRMTLHRICEIAEAATVEDVWQRIVTALRPHGFVRVNYGFTRFHTGRGIGDPDDAFFLSTHNLAGVKWWHESGHYLRSVEYRWVNQNVGACDWGWAARERAAGRLSAAECAAMDALDARGTARARAGYTISFPEGMPRSKGAMGLAAERGVPQAEVDAHWADHGVAVLALCQMAHFKLSQMPLAVKSLTLGPRQREVLEWVADGKTLQDVCLLTGLSRSAVEKHLRRARDDLGVETTAQAVAKMAFLNQLFVTGGSRAGQARPGRDRSPDAPVR
ncbi:helix-turn-helix transcriptional regulator [Roseisalinus antarcticus]|uniref:Autoinducer binding domain protein n=1 Tax=Roseisalinus antarcticus TaxID=254357 RepID=A0A1Y5SSQ1_9RHOB|nr:sigma factor-like helix-turn-helix DNA-binding protein [Roseisalinus antarcticus]SLN47443.1 Autoinducer binding domain protein [Roseisalinus antarcticus]